LLLHKSGFDASKYDICSLFLFFEAKLSIILKTYLKEYGWHL
jgi:hypothetical protein